MQYVAAARHLFFKPCSFCYEAKKETASFLQIFQSEPKPVLLLYVSHHRTTITLVAGGWPNELFKEMKKEPNSLTASVWRDGSAARNHCTQALQLCQAQ